MNLRNRNKESKQNYVKEFYDYTKRRVDLYSTVERKFFILNDPNYNPEEKIGNKLFRSMKWVDWLYQAKKALEKKLEMDIDWCEMDIAISHISSIIWNQEKRPQTAEETKALEINVHKMICGALKININKEMLKEIYNYDIDAIKENTNNNKEHKEFDSMENSSNKMEN